MRRRSGRVSPFARSRVQIAVARSSAKCSSSHRRTAWVWSWRGAEDPATTRLVIDLKVDERGTRLTLRHTGGSDERTVRDTTGGSTYKLGALAELLTTKEVTGMTEPLHTVRFPGESDEYRRARDELLEAEIDLRRRTEAVAAKRRALPLGGAVPEDYCFEEVAEGGDEVRLSELLQAGKDTLVVYSFMFPRWPGDTRPGPAGETGKLALAQTPCASCTSILDSLDGAAAHLDQRLDLVVVAKADPRRIRTFAREREWRNLRLLSSHNNAYNRDYQAEDNEGNQIPILNVFVRDGQQLRHTWATELMFAPREEGEDARHVDSIWPIWSVLDMTPQGRGGEPAFPQLRYG